MKKVFIPLIIVVTVFVAGFVGLVVASFTTTTTEFTGQAELKLRFEDTKGKPISVTILDEAGGALVSDASNTTRLFAPFETRETNVFDKLLGGPRPRDANAVFLDEKKKRHEIRLTYDRRGHVWQAVISFPDDLISSLRLESSTLDFQRFVGSKREYHSVISAVAVVGEPQITND